MSLVTLQIVFDDSANSDLLAAVFLDDMLNIDDEGKTITQFLPQSQPWFLVELDPRLQVTAIRTSSGLIRLHGLVTREAVLDPLDVDEAGDTVELEHIPLADPVCDWYGNQPSISRDGRVLTFTGAVPATGAATYQYRAWSYQYMPPVLQPTQHWRTRIVVHVGAA